MNLQDDSGDIKTKLNLHVKKRIKQTNTSPQKRKVDPNSEDPDPTETPTKPPSGKSKAKKPKTQNTDEVDSDKVEGGDSLEVIPPQKVSTLDVLQLLLNEKKRSLMKDVEVIDFIRMKQGPIP